jgi:hypothetical protein
MGFGVRAAATANPSFNPVHHTCQRGWRQLASIPKIRKSLIAGSWQPAKKESSSLERPEAILSGDACAGVSISPILEKDFLSKQNDQAALAKETKETKTAGNFDMEG